MGPSQTVPHVRQTARRAAALHVCEYSTTRWLGFKGVVKANPFYQICRSQQDVEIRGDWRKLRHEARDSHWMMVYGDYLREVGYAARKLGLEWVNVSGNT